MNTDASSLDVADSSDWLQTTFPKLAPFESALRCQVCKDFFNTPMITTCSHTFCSLCIRRCLTNDGKCPTCRAPDQELRLRLNWTVQEIVETFQLARPSLTSLASHSSAYSEVERSTAKRKLAATDRVDDADEPTFAVQRRKTRSQANQQLRNSEPEPAGEGRLSEPCSNLLGATTRPFDDEPSTEVVEGNGSAACPICGQRMQEEAVFLHLDTHDGSSKTLSPEPTKRQRSPSVEIERSRTRLKPPERLPQLNYSLMKDAALRKKLSDLGIPNTGPRSLLIRRHAEWINIVNANADSSRPRSKREMLRELDVWDRSTGRSITNGGGELKNGGSVMRKDFDAASWSLNHKSDFQDLISKARQSGRSANASEKGSTLPCASLKQENHSSPDGILPRDSLPERHLDGTVHEAGDI
ncbi:MAG: hypothetical protein Q9182_007122 [Xanthomendoza sp. 2 TL-2023]